MTENGMTVILFHNDDELIMPEFKYTEKGIVDLSATMECSINYIPPKLAPSKKKYLEAF